MPGLGDATNNVSPMFCEPVNIRFFVDFPHYGFPPTLDTRRRRLFPSAPRLPAALVQRQAGGFFCFFPLLSSFFIYIKRLSASFRI